jgi:hypothetical protein
MTQNDNELLLKDLCARLPYGVKVTWDGKHPLTVTPHIYCAIASEDNINNLPKLFLRPMSSMTEEELYEIQEILGKGVEIRDVFITIVDSSIDTFSYLELQAVFDWLNKNMFDYRGLLERGLAISVTKENNPYKE